MPPIVNAAEQIGFPILTVITFLPVLGAIIMMFVNKANERFHMVFAILVTAVTFLVSLPIAVSFDTTSAGFQFVEHAAWVPSLGISYHVGIDGISILLILLTTLLSLIAVLSSWSAIQLRVKEYYIFMLLLETGMLGVFISLDMFLFYVFWEVMLVPMYFLIGVWGGPRKLYAAIKFFLYTLAGSLLMLVAILALYFYNYGQTGVYTFDALQLLQVALPFGLQRWLFLAFFVAFAIKVPMFPFHTWLPDAHVEAPTAGSVILAGVLLKMGTYGFLRFSIPLFPDAALDARMWVLVLSIIGIVYGALVAMMQPDMKKLVAYSSVSHLGFCMLGIFALTPEGLTGGILQMINHGLSTGALFLIVGLIYERRHTRMISEFGGISRIMPVYATFFAITTLSSIGLPGLNGFWGEFLILMGAFRFSKVLAIIATSGIVLGAAYMLWMFQRVMFGKVDKPENQQLKDLNAREVITLVPIVLLMFWIGLYPKFWLDYLTPTVDRMLDEVNRKTAVHLRMDAPAPTAPIPGLPPAADMPPADRLPALED
ncbi:NADH-quinone oxidoreductase subunit M [bacterium]|nr:NADH-quinone oxidoreductase subunit M [candidate division CSSED10-310 bacterium]